MSRHRPGQAVPAWVGAVARDRGETGGAAVTPALRLPGLVPAREARAVAVVVDGAAAVARCGIAANSDRIGSGKR